MTTTPSCSHPRTRDDVKTIVVFSAGVRVPPRKRWAPDGLRLHIVRRWGVNLSVEITAPTSHRRLSDTAVGIEGPPKISLRVQKRRNSLREISNSRLIGSRI